MPCIQQCQTNQIQKSLIAIKGNLKDSQYMGRGPKRKSTKQDPTKAG